MHHAMRRVTGTKATGVAIPAAMKDGSEDADTATGIMMTDLRVCSAQLPTFRRVLEIRDF